MDDSQKTKVEHAKAWVGETLQLDDGPRPGESAVLVVITERVPDAEDPDTRFLNVRALPDIHLPYLIDALETFVAQLKEGQFNFTPHQEGKEIDPGQIN